MACNCNKNNETNCYHLNFGCVTPVVANAENYYTKSEIDEKIDDIVTSGCCITPEEVDEKIESAITDIDLSSYAKKSEIPTVPTKVSAFENDVPYLTEHQSLSGYATEQWVENKHYITGVDLSDYATKNYVSGYTYDKATIDEKVAGGGSFDPTQYYNKTATNALLDEKLDVTAYTPTDLSNYDTKAEVNTKISTATGLVNNTLTAHTANTTVHVTAAEKSTWNNKSDFSGNYNDLTNKPTIPNYSAGDGISISNNVISTVTKFWCGDEAAYNQIAIKDPNTIYLIH